MNSPAPTPNVIRDGIRELLALLSDAEAQRAYERSVPIAHVPAELVSMWFDDQYHPNDPSFMRAFSPGELAALAGFHREYLSVADELKPLPASVAELHAHPAWVRLHLAARSALRRLDAEKA